ncbi:subtilisin-like protein [Podospora australis]|uniref:tripeptidyl-peptidase II n=1 Tax=Podospora australis TaxID=1536484 RepID=A0AAN6WJT3_9PEZI|nr:subtilisin-like protein [Podospora australis]
MMLLSILAVAAVASARVMDHLAAVPKGWEQLHAASPDDMVSLRIALKQQHAEVLEQAVIDMSTPGHSSYGRHLTRDQLRSYTAAPRGSADAVVEWLEQHGIHSAQVDNDWISFTTSVDKAGALLKTRFAWFQYTERGADAGLPQLRTLEYSVPDEIARHIDIVQPTTRFGQPRAQRSTVHEYIRPSGPVAKINFAATDLAGGCNSTVTPACLKWLYNINYTATNSPENLVAFASFLEQYARYDDLQAFERTYVPEALGQNFTTELVNGGLDDQKSWKDSGEANLDLQYILGISHPIPILQYSTGGRGPLIPTETQPRSPGSNEPYLEWLTHLVAKNDGDLPQTISVSYGEEEQSVPREYAEKVCNLFMQLGARGVSVIFASGDSGPGNTCHSNTNNATWFEPVFPGACPFVTSVGATYGTNPEKAIDFSSGGFSQYHSQPAWQREAVEPYLRSINTTYAQFYKRQGRGFPDVAAQGSSFAVRDKGYLALLSGTSASAPVFAGIVALLNAARRTRGLPPLGFLNPWLYANKQAFTDITEGAGVGCRFRKELKYAGGLPA